MQTYEKTAFPIKDTYINALRGLASIIIVIHHYALWYIPEVNCIGAIGFIQIIINKVLSFCGTYGSYALDSFFFFSGYLMVIRYHNFDNISLTNFLYKRIKKLYPLLLISVITFWVIDGHTLMHSVRNLLLLHCGFFNDSPQTPYRFEVAGASWFLPPLFVCYILYYLINKKANRENICLLYGLLALIGMIINECGWNYPFINQTIASGLIGFFCGAVFSTVWNTFKCKFKDCPITILASAVLFIAIYEINMGTAVNLRQTMGLIIMPCLMIIGDKQKIFRRIMSNKILNALGDMSLYLYLLHLPVRRLLILIFDLANCPVTNYSYMLIYFLILFVVTVLYSKIGYKYPEYLKKLFLTT